MSILKTKEKFTSCRNNHEKRTMIVAPSVNTEVDIIVPKTSEKSPIVKHFYQIYKGEHSHKKKIFLVTMR